MANGKPDQNSNKQHIPETLEFRRAFGEWKTAATLETKNIDDITSRPRGTPVNPIEYSPILEMEDIIDWKCKCDE